MAPPSRRIQKQRNWHNVEYTKRYNRQMSDVPINPDGVNPETQNSSDYWRMAEKAMETIRIGVETTEVAVPTAAKFCSDLGNNPITPISFFDTRTGQELEAMNLIVQWYANRREEMDQRNKDFPVYQKEQQTGAILAGRILQAHGDKLDEISSKYGPFAKYVDPTDAIKVAQQNLSPSDIEVLSDPASAKFLKEKVYGVAVPNVAYSRILLREIERDHTLHLDVK